MKHLTITITLTLVISLFHCSAQNSTADTQVAYNSSKSRDSNREPAWVTKTPKSISSYHFVGMGTGVNKSEAAKAARQDALGQVVLMINSTISTNDQFETVYEESSNSDQYKLEKKAYSKIKVKGESAISDFQIRETYYEDNSDSYGAYVLAEMPKAKVKDAINRMIKLRQELSDTPTSVVAISVNSKDNDVYYNENLKSFFESFYKSQGYKIVNVDIDPKQINGATSNAQISQVKGLVGDKAKKIIFASIRLTNARTETNSGFQFYVVEGTLTISELNTENDEVTAIQQLSGKGISKHDYRKAFTSMEKKLVQNFTGESEDDGYY